MPTDTTTGLDWHLEITDQEAARNPDVLAWIQQCEALIDKRMKEQVPQPPSHGE